MNEGIVQKTTWCCRRTRLLHYFHKTFIYTSDIQARFGFSSKQKNISVRVEMVDSNWCPWTKSLITNRDHTSSDV